MWHEARKQERKIRGMLVDYRKRAERRQDFYEKIKADPTQFMQIHSRRCKIHMDAAVSAAGSSPAIMMPWQGMQDNMIDRFDGRAYLDLDKIPIAPKPAKDGAEPELSMEERMCNYERYRILAQNDFLGISEEKYLQQLHLEEQFGVHAQIELDKPKKKSGTGAAIGYTYEDSIDTTPAPQFSQTIAQVSGAAGGGGAQASGQQDEDSDSDLDVDVAIDITKIDTAQANELNACGRHYGMTSNDFYSYLTRDADEAESLKLAREEEQEKIMLSGRKSRRERRAQRERRFAGRTISPPSYAAKEDQVGLAGDLEDRGDSAESRSPSPENSGKITFITSFGGEDELQPHSKISINFNNSKSQSTVGASGQSGPSNPGLPVSYADKVRENLDKLKKLNQISHSPPSNSPKKPLAYQRRRSYSRDRSRTRSRSAERRTSIRKRRSRSSSISRSRRRRSRSRNRSRRYSRSRSRSARRSRSHSSTRRSRSRRHFRSSSSNSSSASSRSPPRRRYRTPSSSSSSTSPASSSSRSSSRSNSSAIHSKRFEMDIHKSDVVKTEPKCDPTIVALSSIKPKIEPAIQPAINSIIMEEPVVPIRRYYGRKRDDQTSSDEDNKSDTDGPDGSASTDRPEKSTNITQSSGSFQAASQLSLATSNSNSATSSSAGHHQQQSNATKSSSPFSSKFGKQPTTSTVDTKSGHKSQQQQQPDVASSASNPRDRLKRKMQILLNKQYKADKLAEIEKSERQVQMQQEREEEIRELALRLRRRQRELRHKYGTPTSSHSDDGSERHSDDEPPTNRSGIVQPSRYQVHSSNKNGSSYTSAASSFVPKANSPTPYRQRSRSRSRSPIAPQRSTYHSTRDRPSRFSDNRTTNRGSRDGGGYSGRSHSYERSSDQRRPGYGSNDSRRHGTGGRYAEPERTYQSRPNNNQRGSSREKFGRGNSHGTGGPSGGSNRNRYGGSGSGNGGSSSSRKLVDY